VNLVVSGLDLKSKPAKVLLKQPSDPGAGSRTDPREKIEMEPQEEVGRVEIADVKFDRINVKLLEKRYVGGAAKCRIHYSLMAAPAGGAAKASKKTKKRVDADGVEIPRDHPFYGLKVGDVLEGATVAATEKGNEKVM
jgi:hypothetical protein